MHHRRLPQTAAAATAAVATLGLGVGTAVAATTSSGGSTSTSGANAPLPKPPKDAPLAKNPTLQQIQATAKTDIANRVTTLNEAIATIQGDPYLGGDKPTVLASLQGDIPGLQSLGTKIAADTTQQTALADFGQIFTGFRVYALELPRTELIRADDHILNERTPHLTADAVRIKAKETPANQAQVQPLLADLANQVGAARSGVRNEVPRLEGYTPAAWNANHDLLKPDQAATKAADADVKKAEGDAKQAAGIVGLHGTKAAATPSTTS